MNEFIADLADSKEWVFELSEDGLLTIILDWAKLYLFIHICQADMSVIFNFPILKTDNKDCLPDMCNYINFINSTFSVGTFEIAIGKNLLVNYKTAFSYEDMPVNNNIIKYYIEEHIFVADEFVERFFKIIEENYSYFDASKVVKEK